MWGVYSVGSEEVYSVESLVSEGVYIYSVESVGSEGVYSVGVRECTVWE